MLIIASRWECEYWKFLEVRTSFDEARAELWISKRDFGDGLEKYNKIHSWFKGKYLGRTYYFSSEEETYKWLAKVEEKENKWRIQNLKVLKASFNAFTLPCNN